MRAFIDSMNSLSILLKIILAIPALDIVWNIYRIVCAVEEKNFWGLVVAIVLCFIPVTWIADIIFILMKGNVWRYTA